MTRTNVTIAVVPRERFSVSLASLASIYENTKIDFQLIYVDGNSPPHIAAELKKQAKAKGLQLLRYDRYLTPNQARNIAIKNATTEYIVFVDNDNFVRKDWLEKLVECADGTGSAHVAPVYLEGSFENELVHTAGGIGRIDETAKGNYWYQEHWFEHRKLSEVQSQMKAMPVSLVEFHVLLSRKSFFEERGLLDENYLSMAEENDVCIRAAKNGDLIYLQPEAVVAYDYTWPYEWTDLPFFQLRWSDLWTLPSIEHYKRTWNFADDDIYLTHMLHWVWRHRAVAKLPGMPFDANSTAGDTLRRGVMKVIRHSQEFAYKWQTMAGAK